MENRSTHFWVNKNFVHFTKASVKDSSGNSFQKPWNYIARLEKKKPIFQKNRQLSTQHKNWRLPLLLNYEISYRLLGTAPRSLCTASHNIQILIRTKAIEHSKSQVDKSIYTNKTVENFDADRKLQKCINNGQPPENEMTGNKSQLGANKQYPIKNAEVTKAWHLKITRNFY